MTLYEFDAAIQSNGNLRIAGVDEAGRGPLAGPVIAAAVILNASAPIEGINDSKKLSEAKREKLYPIITSQAIAWAVGQATPEEIDSINILNASLLAMHRALSQLSAKWDMALVDGNRAIKQLRSSQQQCIVSGDAKSASIAAASIIAKVTRDHIMCAYDKEFPQYGFAVHKGYPTKMHRELLRKHGRCTIHRLSFCANILFQTELTLS
jgi:ribonuclease HII